MKEGYKLLSMYLKLPQKEKGNAMKILISGGTGLIGTALTGQLVRNGHYVFILSRSPEKIGKTLENVRTLKWDAKTSAGWADSLEPIDAVVNLAGYPLNGVHPLDIWLTKRRRIQLLSSRLDAANALVEWIRKTEHKPKVFIQASAIGYYGPQGNQVVDEHHPPGTDFLARVQVEAEKSTEILEAMGVRRVIARTGLVLAEKGSALEYFKLQFRLFAGGRMGSGRHYYSWIHIRDEVAAIQFLIENEAASGAYNLTSPHPATNLEFAKTLGRVMRRPSSFIIPAFALRLALGEVSTVVLDGQRTTSKKLEDLGFTFSFPNLESALSDVL